MKKSAIQLAGIGMLALAGAARPALAKDGGGQPSGYRQTNLVADTAGAAAVTDPNLVNPWGLARGPSTPWWVADNGKGVATIYDQTGATQLAAVAIPNVPGVADPSPPTGAVFNGSATDFVVAAGQPAHFLFALATGGIAGWNAGPSAALLVNRGGSAVYTGLTIARLHDANVLYAANFAGGSVDVFDAAFHPVALAAGAFADPSLPANFAPFNVQALGGDLVVTFAARQPNSAFEAHGPGQGAVEIFSADGTRRLRLQQGAWFNAPWGVARAPEHFAGSGHPLLIGQFGGGQIASFDPGSGRFLGLLNASNGRPLAIDGIWALRFGNDAAAGPADTLFFTAGPQLGAHGLFGSLTAIGGDDHDAPGNAPGNGDDNDLGNDSDHGQGNGSGGGPGGAPGNSGPGGGMGGGPGQH